MTDGARAMVKCRLPDFVIIGAQKSASTFVQDALSSHPDIRMPDGETRFFEDPEYGSGDIRELAALFDGCRQRLLGIKRPDYLGRSEVPARIREHLPAAKIVVVLRNPIERLVSAYYYYINLGFLPAIDINEAIPKLLQGDTFGNPKTGELLAYGRYATHLERYRRIFPDDQLHVLFQEDIQAEPRRQIDDVCRFLGVDPAAIRRLPPRANTGVYPLRRLRFLGLRNRFMYDYHPVTGKIIRKKLNPARLLPAGAITLADRWLLARMIGNDKPVLDAMVRGRLLDYYRDEIDGTARLTGRELAAWR